VPFLAYFDQFNRIFLTSLYFVVELVAGVWLDSLSLQADAFHMASDIMGLFIALYAENAKGANRTTLATYGFVRADAVGSLINTTFLLSTCFTIAIDALSRFREVDELERRMANTGIPLLIVASVGLGINVIGLLFFGDQMHVLIEIIVVNIVVLLIGDHFSRQFYFLCRRDIPMKAPPTATTTKPQLTKPPSLPNPISSPTML
jgi:cation diffusion facilitator family transporter